MPDRLSCRPLPHGRPGDVLAGGLWIDRGLLRQDGPVAKVCAAYQRFTQLKRMNSDFARVRSLVRPCPPERVTYPAIAGLGHTRRVI